MVLNTLQSISCFHHKKTNLLNYKKIVQQDHKNMDTLKCEARKVENGAGKGDERVRGSTIIWPGTGAGPKTCVAMC